MEAGLNITVTFKNVIADIGKADFFLPAFHLFRERIKMDNSIDQNEAQLIVDSLIQASEENVFFGATNFYSYIVKKSEVLV